jgi:NADPH:quinone reductase-like Zn-dependent oxidoreductase
MTDHEALVSGPVISAAGSRTLGLLIWWKPFDPADVAHIVGLVEAGAIVPVIDRTFPFAEVPDALRHLADGRARGKVVITM